MLEVVNLAVLKVRNISQAHKGNNVSKNKICIRFRGPVNFLHFVFSVPVLVAGSEPETNPCACERRAKNAVKC